jgi:hypothetical protein
VLNDHAVDAVIGQGRELVAQSGNTCRGAIGREEFARMRLERHDGGDDAACLRGGGDARQQRLVSPMHAVEIADRQCTRDAFSRTRNSAENLHTMLC